MMVIEKPARAIPAMVDEALEIRDRAKRDAIENDMRALIQEIDQRLEIRTSQHRKDDSVPTGYCHFPELTYLRFYILLEGTQVTDFDVLLRADPDFPVDKCPPLSYTRGQVESALRTGLERLQKQWEARKALQPR